MNYQGAVSPGDWVAAWIHESQDQIDNIVSSLSKDFSKGGGKEKSNAFNDWDSGLKFLGKVINVATSDSVSAGGQRSVEIHIDCQAFLELASSMYFIQTAKWTLQTVNRLTDSSDFFLNKERFKGVGESLKTVMRTRGADLVNPLTPDLMIAYTMVQLLGMGPGDFALPTFKGTGLQQGNFNDAIEVPTSVARISGQPKAKYLHQFYTVLLGLQTYGSSAKGPQAPWENFSPIIEESVTKNFSPIEDNVFFFMKNRCKGYIGFKPFSFGNVSYWQAFQEFLHPQLNEMYTVLRCDKFNRIRPHIVVREMPFGTGLFKTLQSTRQSPVLKDVEKKSRSVTYTVKKGDTLTKIAKRQGTTVDKLFNSNKGGGKNQIKDKNWIYPGQVFKIKDAPETKKPPSAATPSPKRAMYCDLPRWEIDESMLTSVNVATDENKRVNFCQVFATNASVDFAGGSKQAINARDLYIGEQLLLGNYVADSNDIKRAGLRADIVESQFDKFPVQAGTEAPMWARIRADWLFNGHLKLAGNINTIGISSPICEGDNLETRGVVYHIESVTHTASISSNGQKQFRTSLGVSSGILANSLTSENDPPSYACHLPDEAGDPLNNRPGMTDYQTGENRNANGDFEPVSIGRAQPVVDGKPDTGNMA